MRNLGVVVVVLSGCGFGFGRVVASGRGHETGGGGGGGGTVDNCTAYDDYGICQAHDYSIDTHADDEPSSSSDEPVVQTFTGSLPFGMDVGAEIGYGSAHVGDAKSSGYTAHYQLELVVPRAGYGVAVQVGYTTQHLPDIGADVAYSGLDAVAKLLLPLGNATGYVGLGWVWGALSDTDAGGFRGLGGLMIELPLRTYSLLPRVELQYTSAGDVDYSALAGVGSLSFMF
jgi:hypothetical protein